MRKPGLTECLRIYERGVKASNLGRPVKLGSETSYDEREMSPVRRRAVQETL